MPPRNVYTGRANKGTLTTVESAGKLYIVYASGQEVVIHSNSRCYVQSVSHTGVSETITRLAASPGGQLAAVSGHIITVFEDTHLDGGEWKYASHFVLERTNSGAPINCCEWMDDQRLFLAIDDILSLWAVSEGVWTKQWERSVGCHIDKISAAIGQAVFATMSFDSRMVKIWQIPEIGGYLRFHGDLRFVLAATIDAARDYAESGLGSNKRRKLVSVNAQCRRRTRTIIQDSDASDISKCSAGDNSKSAASFGDDEGSSTKAHGSSENAIEDYTSVANSTVDSSHCPTSDYIYGVYSDGSMEVWELSPHTHLCTMVKVNTVMQTGAVRGAASLPMTNRLLLQSLLWNPEVDNTHDNDYLFLAIVDAVGHVLLFRAPSLKNEFVTGIQELQLQDLWDGHKEPVFHISVDPYSQRVATHSIEGELLIWDSIDVGQGKKHAISRKMALDGSQIRTIAWAPSESEFIAATGKRVYCMLYNKETEEWAPSSMKLPELRKYDRIFTYPADPVDKLADQQQKQQAYYISTIESASRTVQSWLVAQSGGSAEFVGSTVLKGHDRFDRVSRVMPVAHPFFSRDNVMATFDTSSGKLRIWGIRTDPKFVWFCSKEHRLPCMNVEMIRYNSIDKAAIVSTEADDSQVITIWIFSSASRASHYLPAGTIHPRRKADRVREIRWHLTDYAQTYLGIQWDDRIDIFCQERNLDDAWLCVYTIATGDFGPGKTIGSFSFTASGEPIFSIDRKLIVCTQAMPDGRTLENAAYEEHGQLPLIHPYVLTELMSWGRVDVARRLLAQLYDYMREKDIDSSRKVPLPTVSLRDLLSSSSACSEQTQLSGLGPGNSSRARNAGFKYLALFGSADGEVDNDGEAMGTSLPDFGRLTQDKAEYILEKLTEIKIDSISPIDQARLMSIVGTISASLTKDQPIDSMGIRYLVKLQLLDLENKRKRSTCELPYRELNWAMHSSSQAILLQVCLQQQQQGTSAGLTWESARRMGIFVWLTDTSVMLSEVEKMARNMFVTDGRDPSRCAIFYLALRKQRLLHGLWRTAHGHPDHGKMVTFMSHDFSEQRWKTAAAKNAYVLLSRQRYLDSATFFLLSDKLADAATICVTQLKDVQLAITICRCYEGDNGPVLKDILWKHVLPDAFRRQDRWLASMVFGLIGKYDLVLQSLTDDLTRLAQQIGVNAEVSGYSTMDVLDTELLILYRNMLNHSPYYRAPLVTQAELIAQTITIFECLGAPVMSLVVLEWWRRELYDITKKSIFSRKTQPAGLSSSSSMRGSSSGRATNGSAVDSISSGVLDTGAMSIFAGFGGSKKPAQLPQQLPAAASDPLASGMLSMDSFGSMFSGMSAKPKSKPNSFSAGSQREYKLDDRNVPSNEGSVDDGSGDSALAVEIEDTPVQYACRVALALQIMEFVERTGKINSSPGTFDVDEEKRTVAETLRLPLSTFP
ncbi:regulator of (H+)-ATPase in vacuolar membrane [Kickxella alabastrina]|uniref:Regulator of (H+)-ATPase in vacuolar membrane n=1 Tax=Kickxella alabastrina TaxID=61397 RepID=A0ACC1IQT7_9FUNG|nr:regulator of (H+)-ATPase in vacuolar membrane [Kickxella alabastrina]